VRARTPGTTPAAKSLGRLRGSAKAVKGSLRRAAGDLLDDDRLRAEGEAERAAGRVRRKLNE
jgi:uncharacterized protein YjbJ (UPF0337 family)